MLRWVLAVAGMLQPTLAVASDWKPIAIAENGTVIFADVTSVKTLEAIPIQRPFPVVQLWFKADHSKNKKIQVRYTVEMQRVNCADETALSVSTISYLPNGDVSRKAIKEDYDFNYEPAIPETLSYAKMEFACGRAAALGQAE